MLKTAAAAAATATIIISVIIIIKGYAHTLTHRRTERHKLNETVGKNGLKAKAAATNRNRTIQRTPYNLYLMPY